MPLYVKDREVGELAERLASVKKVSKTDAVRMALKNELGRSAPDPIDLERLARLQRRIREMTGPDPRPVTREWIDSLYEDG